LSYPSSLSVVITRLGHIGSAGADPDCVTNLAGEAAHRRRAAAMREKLFAELKRQGDPRMAGKGVLFNNYPTTKKKE